MLTNTINTISNTPIKQVFLATLADLFLLMIGPVVVVLALTYINRNTKKIIANTLGPEFQVWLGGIGICIHEFSHFIFAVLFGHSIKGVKLVVLPWNVGKDGDDSLGYVNHSWNNRSIYQSIGNLFIGTAPIWGCTLVLSFLTKYLNPNMYQASNQFSRIANSGTIHLSDIWQIIGSMNFPDATFVGIAGYFLWVVLSVNICVGGYDLSSSDFKNAKYAFFEVYFLLAVILFAGIYLGAGAFILGWITKLLVWFILVMLIAILSSLAANFVFQKVTSSKRSAKKNLSIRRKTIYYGYANGYGQ